MTEKTFTELEKFNQFRLSSQEKAQTLELIEKIENDYKMLDSVNTENVLPMVHVMPKDNALRQDEMVKTFSRDDLQTQAPAVSDGYWEVPRLVE